MIPDRPNFGTGPGGGSGTEERLQEEWDAKYAPDLETARRTIDELLAERAERREHEDQHAAALCRFAERWATRVRDSRR